MLIDKHSDRYSAYVKSVKEVLDVAFHDMIDPFNVLELENAMRHGFDNVGVAVAYQVERFRKIFERVLVRRITRFKVDNFKETLLIPIVQQSHGRSSSQVVRQQTQFLHDIRQTNWKFLPEKDERPFFAEIFFGSELHHGFERQRRRIVSGEFFDGRTDSGGVGGVGTTAGTQPR